VDVGPLFGKLLARQFAEMWRLTNQQRGSPLREDPGPFGLVEAAASNGQLARDILDAADTEDPEFYSAVRLHLVESSPAARTAQRQVLGTHASKLVYSAGRLPDVVHGVIYANELLDALPVHRLEMTAGGLREVYVDLLGDRLVERLGALSNAALERYLSSVHAVLEPGWRADVSLSAIAWATRACLTLHEGFLVLIDYGHEAYELYSATHAAGTLTTFTRHVSGDAAAGVPPWLVAPGTRDLTAHVDLTAVRHTAEELGCETLGILDQTYFLLALAEAGAGGDPDVLAAGDKERRALKTLVMPGGLGSTMKVMVFAKGIGRPSLRGLSGITRLT
jgi:SAM-dependent MidA family methyltransferase